MTEEFWFRYENHRYAAPVDEWGDVVGRGHLEVVLLKLRVLKHTPKGVWLDASRSRMWSQFRCFVLRDARKRFACPTIEDAKESFVARKQRQARIYRARLADAEEAICIIEEKSLMRMRA